MDIASKEAVLLEFLRKYSKPAIAFSGGVDSSVLLAACVKAGVEVQPIMADTVSVPAFEKQDAANVAKELGVELHRVQVDPLTEEHFAKNTADHCYYCKKLLMGQISVKAAELGCEVIFDGVNKDDLGDYRPGLKAAKEAGIVSPLLACNMTKAEVRELAHKYSLSVADKPAYACLASRIAYGEPITIEKLKRVETAEEGIRALGFNNVRVRCHGTLARIEVSEQEISIIGGQCRKQIVELCKAAGFSFVCLDLQGYRTGSMNSLLKK